MGMQKNNILDLDINSHIYITHYLMIHIKNVEFLGKCGAESSNSQ